MFPYIRVFDRNISMYGIMAMIGVILCLFYVIRVCKREKIDDYKYVNMLLFSIIGILIGGHLLYGITNINLFIELIKNIGSLEFKEIIIKLATIFGGSVFYGGLIGGCFTAYIYAKRVKINNCETYDMLIPVVPLFHFFGRIGCFLVGCCYGVESSIGFTFHNSIIESANNVNRFPVQLVEALFNLILFFCLYNFFKHKKFKGYLLNIYFIFYPVFRFIIEFFRGDSYRGFLFGLSTSQIISIILLICSIINLFYRLYYSKKGEICKKR